MSPTTENAPGTSQRGGVGSTYDFEQINDPCAYICNWSGHLLRVPDDAIKPGRSPVLVLRGREPLRATKLSDDPVVALTKARMIASDLDLAINF